MEQLLPGIELVNDDCAAALPGLAPANLILTSPPYDGLRDYGGYNGAFNFDAVAAACVANLAPGGVLVWVVRDAVMDGGETGTRFRQALAFIELGLRLHQTLIYYRWTLAGMTPTAYYRIHNDMFVFSKGKLRIANLLNDKLNNWANYRTPKKSVGRKGDIEASNEVKGHFTIPEYSRRGSVWQYKGLGKTDSMPGDLPYNELNAHPARFPVALARDHILTWTNPGDLVIDPMAGSDTTFRGRVGAGLGDWRRGGMGGARQGAPRNPAVCRLLTALRLRLCLTSRDGDGTPMRIDRHRLQLGFQLVLFRLLCRPPFFATF